MSENMTNKGANDSPQTTERRVDNALVATLVAKVVRGFILEEKRFTSLKVKTKVRELPEAGGLEVNQAIVGAICRTMCDLGVMQKMAAPDRRVICIWAEVVGDALPHLEYVVGTERTGFGTLKTFARLVVENCMNLS